MITILLPTYNYANYIEKCIQSILEQTYKDYELLVLDDGSIDNTTEIVERIKDKRIHYLKNPANLGIVETLNLGIKLAKGKYIARMDADDIMVGNRLQMQVDFLDQNPQFGIVGSWYKIMDSNGRIISEMKNYTDPDYLRLGLMFTNHFAHPTVMMRTKLVKKLLYDKNFLHCEDHELWTRFSEISKVTNLPFFFLNVRSHSQSTCNLNQKELKTSVIKLLSKELNKKGICHTPKELMLHASICFGSSKKLVGQKEVENDLRQWFEKIFSSSYLKKNFSQYMLDTFKVNIMKNAGLETEQE
ncbi:glycosyltransferase family 2 protein [Pedobacter planticolens]|uniref:glycosyltransferase family 2 protein n=1 Tax=Pedobacter planticolens TaxID=2679964 RepID=UPI001601FC82|nr:glycosyltransferase [Pedobacter planticolens]